MEKGELLIALSIGNNTGGHFHAVDVLERHGFITFAADRLADAVDLCSAIGGFDLIISEAMLRDQPTADLVALILEHCPSTPLLVVSDLPGAGGDDLVPVRVRDVEHAVLTFRHHRAR